MGFITNFKGNNDLKDNPDNEKVITIARNQNVNGAIKPDNWGRKIPASTDKISNKFLFARMFLIIGQNYNKNNRIK